MKKRKVYVMLEIWTDAPLEDLSSKDAWQNELGNFQNMEVLQAQANVSQDPPMKVLSEEEVKEADAPLPPELEDDYVEPDLNAVSAAERHELEARQKEEIG